MKLKAGTILTWAAIGSLAVGGWVALGGRFETPAEVNEEHVDDFEEHAEEFHDHTETFEGHVAHIDTFVAQYEASEQAKVVSRTQRTLMVEAQTKLTCLTTGSDTIAMLSLTSICGDLGVPVN